MGKNRYIRFDWAAKYMLRNKADFAIFEGLISVLVKEKVTIVELLDTESNKQTENDKYNRVEHRRWGTHSGCIPSRSVILSVDPSDTTAIER